ncbi:MAG: hypothetical protein ACRDHZ_04070, partial [Ktedonobacteraceae bacterium]
CSSLSAAVLAEVLVAAAIEAADAVICALAEATESAADCMPALSSALLAVSRTVISVSVGAAMIYFRLSDWTNCANTPGFDGFGFGLIPKKACNIHCSGG